MDWEASGVAGKNLPVCPLENKTGPECIVRAGG